MSQGVGQGPRRTAAAPRWPRVLWAGTAAACLALAWLAWPQADPIHQVDDQRVEVQPEEDDLPFLVARADEIAIIGMEGGDTDSLVVGEPPVRGPLELATKDEIRVTNMQPDGADRMVPRVVGNRPMIWAFLDSERD